MHSLRERESWALTQPSHTDDDYNEVRRALKNEQLARLHAEERLRAAQTDARNFRDDAHATRLALEITQRMAANLVDGEASGRPVEGKAGECVKDGGGVEDERGRCPRGMNERSAESDAACLESGGSGASSGGRGREDDLAPAGADLGRGPEGEKSGAGKDTEASGEDQRAETFANRGASLNPFELFDKEGGNGSVVVKRKTSRGASREAKEPELPSQGRRQRRGKADHVPGTGGEDVSNPFTGEDGVREEADGSNPFKDGKKAQEGVEGKRKAPAAGPLEEEYENPFGSPVDWGEGKNPFEKPAGKGPDGRAPEPEKKTPADASNPFLLSQTDNCQPAFQDHPPPGARAHFGRVTASRSSSLKLPPAGESDWNPFSGDVTACRTSSLQLPGGDAQCAAEKLAAGGPEWNPFLGNKENSPDGAKGAVWNPFHEGAEVGVQEKGVKGMADWNPFD